MADATVGGSLGFNPYDKVPMKRDKTKALGRRLRDSEPRKDHCLAQDHLKNPGSLGGQSNANANLACPARHT